MVMLPLYGLAKSHSTGMPQAIQKHSSFQTLREKFRAKRGIANGDFAIKPSDEFRVTLNSTWQFKHLKFD